MFIKIKPADVCEFYSYLPFGNDGYKNMLLAVKRGEVPFLQHCTAGKDRAGCGSALLLAVLGVSYDEIVKDYLKSLKIRDNIRKVMFDKIPKIVHPFIKTVTSRFSSSTKVTLTPRATRFSKIRQF